MEGIFSKVKADQLYRVVWLFLGLCFLAFPAMILRVENLCTIDNLVMVVLLLAAGATMVILSIRAMAISRRIFLHVDSQFVTGSCDGVRNRTWKLEEIAETSLSHWSGGLCIRLKTGQEYCFSPLQNGPQLKAYLDARLTSAAVEQPDSTTLSREIQTARRKRTRALCLLGLGAGDVLGVPLVTAICAGKVELATLGAGEQMTLAVLGLIWFAGILVALGSLRRCGRYSRAVDALQWLSQKQK